VVSTFALDTPHGPVPARLEGEGTPGLLLATGAGTGHDHPGVAGLRSRLADAGLTVMTFEYAYRAAGRSFPDPKGRLLDVHRAAAAHLREATLSEIVLAGRSMGGRMSTILASQEEPCAAVVAYGYPLHPAGRPDRLRVEHLAAITVPALFITGTRDSLARPDLVDRYLSPLPTATVELVEDADHSFRRRGTPPGSMLDELTGLTLAWLGDNGLAGSAAEQP